MTARHYGVFVCAEADRVKANRLFAVLFGDDPSVSDTFGRPAGPDGETVSHRYGGMPLDAGQLAAVQNIAVTLPEPEGGWPLADPFLGELLSEADAAAVAGRITTHVTTYDDAEIELGGAAAATVAAMGSALGIAPLN